MYNIRLVSGLFVLRSIPCPSPAILCVTEGLTPLSCISPGSCVNRLLAGEKLRGQKKGRRQGISPSLSTPGIFLGNNYIFFMAPAPAGQTHLASYFLQVSPASGLPPPFVSPSCGLQWLPAPAALWLTSLFPVWVSVPPVTCTTNSLN